MYRTVAKRCRIGAELLGDTPGRVATELGRPLPRWLEVPAHVDANPKHKGLYLTLARLRDSLDFVYVAAWSLISALCCNSTTLVNCSACA